MQKLKQELIILSDKPCVCLSVILPSTPCLSLLAVFNQSIKEAIGEKTTRWEGNSASSVFMATEQVELSFHRKPVTIPPQTAT